MKKIMEIYECDNGLSIIRKNRIYHLFCGVTDEETLEGYKIANKEDAVKFMINFFDGKIDATLRQPDSFNPELRVSFKL